MRLHAALDSGSKLSRFFNSWTRQPRKMLVFPPKPERLRIYVIHTLGIKALTCFAGGTEKLNISLSQKGRFPVKPMEPVTDGAGPGYDRSSGAEVRWREESGSLFFTSLLSVLVGSSLWSLSGWADHAVCLWALQEFSKTLCPGLIFYTRGQVYDSASSSALGIQWWWVIVL